MKFCFALYLLTSLAAASVMEPISAARKTRIIGGNEASAGLFPFVAAINVATTTSRFFCGGAVLGNEWILTAAQCVYNADTFTIVLGSHNLEDNDDPNRLTLATSTYVIHPDFNPGTLDNDIGLIRLRIPIEHTDYIKSVYTIPVAEVPAGWQLLAVGWGQTSDSEAALATNLNFVTLTTLTNEECRLTYGNQVTDNMLCVAGNYNEGTCIGDTGSPLVMLQIFGNAFLQAVASFVSGNGCESTDPSGYTRLYPYVEWITNVTGFAPK